MGWNPFKDVAHFMEKIPGSPEAVMSSLNKGFQGELSWNPFIQGDRSVWDYGAGGSVNSKDPKHRMVGRAIGSYVGGGALGNYFGGSAGAVAADTGGAWGGTAGSMDPWLGNAAGGLSEVGGVAGAGSGWASGTEGGFGPSGAEGGSLGDVGWSSGMETGFGPSGADGGFNTGPTSSPGGGGSYYDQMLDYLKRKGGGMADWFGKTKGSDLARMGAGLYGIYNARQAQKMARMPGDLTSLPGYKAGLDAVQASAAQQGYTGGSNAAAAIGKYGSDFYNQNVNQRLMASQAQMNGGMNTMGSLALLARGFGW